MHHHTPPLQLGRWPTLDWSHWKDTAETLQLYTQIVGKTRLALTPTQNHWWNVPFYVSARGLATSSMPIPGGHLLDIEFDFIEHQLTFRTSRGGTGGMKLSAKPVAEFFTEYVQQLKNLAVNVPLDPLPVEIAHPIRFDRDTVHRTYDSNAVEQFWHALRLADTLLKRFSTAFYGKISPVHFFWGSFDLAVTRFSGQRAPARDGADKMQAEAYSHEVIGAGFWPGNGEYGRAAFYAYAAPVPEGLAESKLTPPGRFAAEMGEFLLDYDDVLVSPDPAATVLNFLQETYVAAAEAAGWNRLELDRNDEVGVSALHTAPRERSK